MKSTFVRNRIFTGAILVALLGGRAHGADERPRITPRVFFPNSTLNGQPVLMELDTGSSVPLIWDTAAGSLGLKVTPLKYVYTNTNNGTLSMSEPANLSVDGQSCTVQLPIYAWQNGPAPANTAPAFDPKKDPCGFIGWPQVQDNILVFDGEQRMVKCVDALPPETSSWLKLKVGGGSMLALETPLPDGKTGDVMVDTGSPYGVGLPAAQWKEWRAAHPKAPTTTEFSAIPGTDAFAVEEVWADEIQLGTITLHDVMVHEGSGVFSASLGLDALERMELVVDGKNGFAYLQARPPINSPTGASQTADGQRNPHWTTSRLRINTEQLLGSSAGLLAISAFNGKDYPTAIARFTEVLQHDPKNVWAYGQRAAAKSQQKDNDGALADFARALEIDPDNSDIYLARANLRMQPDPAGSIADFTEYLKTHPNDAQAYAHLAGARFNQGDYDNAVVDYSHALLLNPKTASTWLWRGYSYARLGAYSAALDDYTRVLELDPKNIHAYESCGDARQSLGDLTGALADYDQAIAIEPKNAGIYASRSLVKRFNGDFTGSIADCNQALELDPKNAAALVRRAEANFLLDNAAGVAADCDQAMELEPKSHWAWLQRGEARQALGDWAGAVADYDKVIELAPNDAVYASLYRQLLLRELKRPPEDFAITVADWKDGWTKSLGQFIAGEWYEAAVLAAAAKGDAKTGPSQLCEADYFMGMMRLLKGDQAGARDFWQKCLATDAKTNITLELARAELARLNPPATK